MLGERMVNLSKAKEWDLCFQLLLDPRVSEIESNGPDGFFLMKSGKRLPIKIELPNDEVYMDGIENGLVPFVKSLNTFNRRGNLFEGQLKYEYNGTEVIARCHIVLPPISERPQVTIAKKTASLKTLEAIASAGSMSTEMMQFLIAAIHAKQTIVISGATGAGKTTMLEALTKYIDMDTRIGVAEDTPELILTQPNVTYMNSVPWQPGMSENDVATLSFVVQQVQRMRIDRIIIGETRGKEFADFLIAANSGLEGSLTTIHANYPQRCLSKMTNFALRGAEKVPIRAINVDIANAVDIIVQLSKMNGRHRVTHIQEVTNTVNSREDATIPTASLYLYDAEKDMFYKDASMSDSMRKRFMEAGVSPKDFLTNTRGVRTPGHNSIPQPLSGAPTRNENNNPFSRRSI